MKKDKHKWLQDKLTKYPEFLDFIESTGAEVILYEKHPFLSHMNQRMSVNAKVGAPEVMGFYAPHCDIIFINPWLLKQKQKTLVRVIAHELGHWTGHKTRLKRGKLARRTGTEEIIAESCFFYLSKHFKIDQKWALSTSSKYIEEFTGRYPKCNPTRGYEKGLEASKFLIDLMNSKVQTVKEGNNNNE